MFLGSAPKLEVIGEAADGVEAVRMTEQLHPNLGLMDFRWAIKGAAA